MSGFLNANLGSDSEEEEDDDYNPNADDTAEREDRPQQAQPGRGGAKKRRIRGAAVSAAEGDGAEGGEDGEDDGEADEEAAEENDPRVAAKRAKMASLWEQINSRAAAKGTAIDRPPSSALNLAALCRSSGGRAAAAALTAEAGPAGPVGTGVCQLQKAVVAKGRGNRTDEDAIWMRSLGLLPKAPKGATGASEAAAAKALQSATGQPRPSAAAAIAAAIRGAAGQRIAQREASPGAAERAEAAAEERRATAAAALAAARDATAVGSRANKVAVTEVRRFAGKDVQVTLHVDKDSKEAAKAAAKATAAAAPAAGPAAATAGGGLDAILAELDKKKKVSVLDKTKADWQGFKASNVDVDEELELHKRSGDQFLEKQNFLKRAELREYEKERDVRLGADVRTRGRL